MIILLHAEATPADADRVLADLESLGVAVEPLDVPGRRAFVTTDGDGPLPAGSLARLPGVDQVVPLNPRTGLVEATASEGGVVVRLGSARFGGGHVGVIAGPCTVESRERLAHTARVVKDAGAAALRGGVFKVRTSPHSYQGGGEASLADMAAVSREVGLPFLTELTDPRQVERVGEVVDGVQIGARNMQNFPLLVEAARLGKPVLLKRHMSASVDEWLLAAEYLLEAGNDQVILCERGMTTPATHVRYLLDIGAVAHVKARVGLPVIVDPSHAAGDWRLVPALARAALAAGADGLIVEVHPAPEGTRCDAFQALPPADFVRLMSDAQVLTRMNGLALSGGAGPDARSIPPRAMGA